MEEEHYLSVTSMLTRIQSADMKNQRRLLDDFELTLIDFFDREGVVSSINKMDYFILLMTRVSKVVKYLI